MQINICTTKGGDSRAREEIHLATKLNLANISQIRALDHSPKLLLREKHR